MKLLILCLGFYLATFTLAKAQDSTQTVSKDTTALSDSTRIPDSTKAENLSKDSVIHSQPDTTDNNHSTTSPFLQPDTTKDPQENAASRDTIVDIFEEMKKAKQEQDRSMLEDGSKDASSEPASSIKADSAQPETPQDSGTITQPDTATWFPIDSSKNNIESQKTDAVTHTSTAISEPGHKLSDSASFDTPHSADSSTLEATDKKNPDSIDSTLFSPPNEATTPPGDANNHVNQAPEKPAKAPENEIPDSLSSPFTDSFAVNPQTNADSLEITSGMDSAAAAPPVKDTIRSLFTTAGDHADTIDAGRQPSSNDSMPDTTALNSSDDAHAVHTEQLVDSSRQEQDTAINEIFSDVEQEKPAAVPADSSNHKGTTVSNNTIADSTAEQRLQSHRQDLDSTINATQAIESGTPFVQLFEPYRKFRKNTTIESTTNLTILQQHVNYKTKADFSTQFQRTGQEGAGYLFDVSVVRLNTEVETMGVQLKYDSNTPSDSTSTFAKPLFDIVGKRTFLKVDSTGRIMAVDTSQVGEQINTVLSGLSLSGGDYEVGSNFGLLLNNSDALKVGSSWQDSIAQGDNKRITSYKVQNLVNDEYIVLISGTVTQTGEIASDGMIFKTHFTGTQKGKMRVDKDTRLIKTKEINLDMKGTVDYQDNELPAAATSKIKENVTEE